MTPSDAVTPLCEHAEIRTFRAVSEPEDVVLWACANPYCSIRFYPACRTCVDVGHRNIVHPPLDATRASPAPDGLDVERLARAMTLSATKQGAVGLLAQITYATGPDERLLVNIIAAEYASLRDAPR